MRIVDVVPKDVWVTLELPMSEVVKILTALDNSKIEYDGIDKPEVAEAVSFLKDVFCKQLAELEEGMKRGA